MLSNETQGGPFELHGAVVGRGEPGVVPKLESPKARVVWDKQGEPVARPIVDDDDFESGHGLDAQLFQAPSQVFSTVAIHDDYGHSQVRLAVTCLPVSRGRYERITLRIH